MLEYTDPLTLEPMILYESLEELYSKTCDALKPPENLTISDYAAKYRKLANAGSYVGLWDNDKTPYLVEPMNLLESREHTGMIFVGPARSGKSDMAFNWLTYLADNKPSDFLMIHMTRAVARNWSQNALAKNLYLNDDRMRPTRLGQKLIAGRLNDNVFDKRFMNGMRLQVGWPVASELSGRTVRNVWVNDMDNMTDDVEGRGNPYFLAKKRTQTFGRLGMTVGEGSPAHAVTDPKWTPSSPHEAPPAEGILSLYNMGDRRRFYWRCPHCKEPFSASFSMLRWPDSKDPSECANATELACPHCGCILLPDMQYDLNYHGTWLREGQLWLPDGTKTDTGRKSDLATFWLKGTSAAFTTWGELVLKYLQAEEEYERTGSETSLFATVTVDQGEPYLFRSQISDRSADDLKMRARDWGGTRERPVVPEPVRFLMAMIDVQAGKKPCFVVHVFGYDDMGGIYHVDMFKLRYSASRFVNEGHPELIDPASYPEDWDILISEVLEKNYELADGSGRRMGITLTACDSGGAEGIKNKDKDMNKEGASVTRSAYTFYTKLRRMGRHGRFCLLKGANSKADRSFLRYSTSSNKFSALLGEVPLWLVNSNLVKDSVANLLSRNGDVAGQVYFPYWAPDWLYQQLVAEVRTDKGWERISHKKNEAFDLLSYALAFTYHPQLSYLNINWEKPPKWAETWDKNENVFRVDRNGHKMLQDVNNKPRLSLKEVCQKGGLE